MRQLLFALLCSLLSCTTWPQNVSLNHTPETRFAKKLSVGDPSTTNQPESSVFMVGVGTDSSKASMLSGVSDTSAVVTPVERMLVYSYKDHKYWYRNEFAWVQFGDGSTPVNQLRVAWDHDLVFNVTSGYYTVDGITYYYPGGDVTLPDGGADNRIDIIVAEAGGTVSSIQGDEAADPVKPQPDDGQIELTSVLILAGGTTPANISEDIVWAENTGSPEWTGASFQGATANFDNTTNVDGGTKSVQVTNISTAGQHIRFTIPSGTFNVGSANHIRMRIRLNSNIASGRNMSITLMNGNTIVTNIRNLSDFGLTLRGLLNVYQTIVIPFSAFTYTNTDITAIRITREGGTIGNFYIDNVSFQKGFTQVIDGDYLPMFFNDDQQINANSKALFLTEVGTLDITSITDAGEYSRLNILPSATSLAANGDDYNSGITMEDNNILIQVKNLPGAKWNRIYMYDDSTVFKNQYNSGANNLNTFDLRVRRLQDGVTYQSAVSYDTSSGKIGWFTPSGAYTPTITGSNNYSGSSDSKAMWMRLGNIVTVSGSVVIDPTAAGLVIFDISLPVASDFTGVQDVAGTGGFEDYQINGSNAIIANATDNRAQVEVSASSGSASFYFYTFKYEIK